MKTKKLHKYLITGICFALVGCSTKTSSQENYRKEFVVNTKYLLIPIQDAASESKLCVNNGIPIDIRVADTKIDYWVPIDVAKYNGEKISLCIAPAKKSAIGYNQIKASNSFDFNYNEKYRPNIHFTPQNGWMNDPNGMVYWNGEYHLFYQHNPYGSKWGNMHWGHAVTKDLKRWEHLPEAISPDSLGTIFSGSAVIDVNNTAGFGKNAMVAIFTSAGKHQVQSLAYSNNNGRTFTKYQHNPVLIDTAKNDFRDPKVFWFDANKQWIMTLATGQTVTFYSSNDLKQWRKLSEFGNGIGAHGGVWECPDLFPLTYNGKTKWALFVNINPGAPNGGSGTQYFIGNFNGSTFIPDPLPYPLWLDYGRDNYAGVHWNNAPNNRQIFIGWMSNWDYGNDVPSVQFKSEFTLPREITIENNGNHLVLASYPVKEIDDMRCENQPIKDFNVSGMHRIDKLFEQNTGSYEICLTVIPQKAKKWSIELINAKAEVLKYLFDMNLDTLSVDRTKSGLCQFSPSFSQISKAPLVPKASYTIRLILDKSSSECFINGGQLVSTNCVFPSEPYNSLVIKSDGKEISVKQITINKLK